MAFSFRVVSWVGASWIALSASSGVYAADDGAIEIINVTAQRRIQDNQDVPIAVSVFDRARVDQLQIESPGDLQLSAPNVSFTKTNFTSTNLQIRAIGQFLTTASSDGGVGIHVNDVPIVTPRLFETEFFDMERLEVLRGPQGTLFGRNATGGVINMISKRPTDTLEGYAEFEYGNYDSVRAQGAVNIPLKNWGAIRLAANYIDRDGYTENLFLGTRIDDRNIYSLRGSLRLTPGENTTIDIVGSYLREDDSRMRAQKQLCDRDPTGVLGCLPTGLGFDTSNAFATINGILSSSAVLGDPATGGLGLALFGQEDINATSTNPRDLRQVSQDFDPQYFADETYVLAELTHQFDTLEATFLASYHETSVVGFADFNGNATADAGPTALAALANLEAIAPVTYAALFANDTFPLSAIDPGNTGSVGGNILENQPNFGRGYDRSAQANEQWFFEARVVSDFGGPLNFLAGANYLHYTSVNDYSIAASGLDYFAAARVAAQGFQGLVAAVPSCGLPPEAGGGFGTPACASPTDGLALVSPFFEVETAEYGLDAVSIFGEITYTVSDALRLTGGLRWTRDRKTISDRTLLFDGPVPIGTADADAAGVLPAFNTSRTALNAPDTLTFSEFTGRFVLDYRFSPNTLAYASYVRGSKSGGFNPPFDPTLLPSADAAFDPEVINSFELGVKSQLLDERLQANVTAFYYDYKDLQVAQIINRTTFTENVDSQIWGAEAEFVFAPREGWLLNLNLSYLDSSIGDISTIDTRDPSGGRADSIVIKDLASAGNCVINGTNDPGAIQTTLASNPATAALAGAYVAIPAGSGLAFGLCDNILNGVFDDGGAQLAPNLAGISGGAFVGADGNPVSLAGNELQNASNVTVSLGAQYTHRFEGGLSLTGRADYYWQSAYWLRIFNDPRTDEVASWDVINLQVTLNGPEERWFVRAFVQNLENDDNVTGAFVTDAATGLFTNIFLAEPRRYGVMAGFNF